MFRFDRTTLRLGNILAAIGIIICVGLDVFLKPKILALYEGYPVDHFPLLSQITLSTDFLKRLGTFLVIFVVMASLYERQKRGKAAYFVLNILIYSVIALTLIGWYWPILILSK